MSWDGRHIAPDSGLPKRSVRRRQRDRQPLGQFKVCGVVCRQPFRPRHGEDCVPPCRTLPAQVAFDWKSVQKFQPLVRAAVRDTATPLPLQQHICYFQMPERRNDGADLTSEILQGVESGRRFVVEAPRNCDGAVQDKARHLRRGLRRAAPAS